MDQEKELRERLGIRLVQCPPPETWPQHLLKTFQQIQSFKDYDISTYPTETPSRSSRLVYRNETVARAKRIATTAKRIIKERIVSEMEWRLRLEELVLARFRLEIDCPNKLCARRIWRSEVEVLVEKPGTIADDLVERREKRLPCLCQSEQKPFDTSTLELNKIFSSRADQLTQYDPFSVDSEDKLETSPIRRRRPDRLLGFQQTERFDHRLSEGCQRRFKDIARKLEADVKIKSIRDMVECTVLSDKNGPLLFPFLVIEAKSEHGKSFHECNKQSAFPIWKMLRIQKDLHTNSRLRLEYGGPLIWYIAYRGHNWRVSGCYAMEKDGETTYEILDLWSGFISDEDGALQLLPIVDYIFDWARDVYQALLMTQLKALARPEEEIGRDEDSVRVATDPDSSTFSHVGRKQTKELEAWDSKRNFQNKMSPFLSTEASSKSQNYEPKSKGKRATPEHYVRSGKAKAPPPHEVFKGAANESTIQHPSQQIPGRSSSELEAATTASILAGYQEFLAKNPSLLVQQSANPGMQPAVEPSEQPNCLSSHPNPRQDLSHANPDEPKLHTISALDFPPQNTSSLAETTPVPPLTRSISPEPSILSTPSTPRTRSAAPSPVPFSAHNKSSGSSKRQLMLGDDRETPEMRKRLKVCADLADKEVIIID